jgi:hypothetical protein
MPDIPATFDRRSPKPPAEEAQEPAEVPLIVDVPKYLADFEAMLAGAVESGDKAALEEVWLVHEGREEGLFPPDRVAAREAYKNAVRQMTPV